MSARSSGSPVTGVLTGAEIEQLDDHALAARVDEREPVLPRHAAAEEPRSSWRSSARGHVVGYLGDGINDAPSLHSADVGLSVDSAVDVAKEAADLILLRARPAACCTTACSRAGAPSATS